MISYLVDLCCLSLIFVVPLQFGQHGSTRYTHTRQDGPLVVGIFVFLRSRLHGIGYSESRYWFPQCSIDLKFNLRCFLARYHQFSKTKFFRLKMKDHSNAYTQKSLSTEIRTDATRRDATNERFTLLECLLCTDRIRTRNT